MQDGLFTSHWLNVNKSCLSWGDLLSVATSQSMVVYFVSALRSIGVMLLPVLPTVHAGVQLYW